MRHSSGVWSLRNLTISVPRGVLSGEGQAVVLRCSYDLEGAALYSIRWYRAETEFYRYVPREMPPTMVFALPGTFVDLAQSDHQQVRIVNLHRRLSGQYQCEVSADLPLFHTDIRSAPLTVVDPPFRAPRLHVSRATYARGDIIRASCTVDASYPAPNITWILDDLKIAEHVSNESSELDFREHGANSSLELAVEAEPYRAGYAALGPPDQPYHARIYPNDGVLRYTVSPPASGALSLSCAASIFDVYSRRSEPAQLREDTPHPASVTRDDSSGGVSCLPGAVTLALAAAWSVWGVGGVAERGPAL